MIEKYSSNGVYSAQQLKTSENIVTKGNDATTEPQVEENKAVNLVDKEKERKNLEGLMASLNDFMPAHTSLKFQLHDKLEEYYVQVIDDQTKEVIREIPSEKMLDIHAAMKEYLGLMVDKKI
ncbi:flagellar protein FlaG [Niallia taxi]|uniref:flagellar protein FlaG n=1 Tax=Niallia taxi TaxID=2499688 RepID=UPI00119D9391|nr:flagellar protein FlaG [Niallia taxi]MCT2347440.1 flagellar protein FlaG [Niallia taxi]MDE5054781.1 flagellar protein FlaG [Niallia taxi]MED3963923.1 flagellar protein FlaG [Niallia taxi]WOD63681.1 flagellar protein FlaG [Niallia taxi]